MEQSTVSRRIARLEDMLGLALFERRRDGLMATDAAEILYPEAESAERSLNRLQVAATGLSTEVGGVVRLAVTESLADLLLIPNLSRLMTQYPKLDIQLITGLRLANIEKKGGRYRFEKHSFSL
ncbi:MAG: LysR family transcriptional regulator [Myxococcales bacterium]|nr:LysR family transcriptional regulator [Myxococcales bacterium]